VGNKHNLCAEVVESTDKAIALWEHTSACGIKRLETALVSVGMSVDSLHHIQAALDAQYGGEGGHSRIIIKRALLITEGLKEKGAE
jgi:hypothetical protein